MTRHDLLKFVASLDAETQKIFKIADELVNVTEDTLGDDFQIAASVVDVFVSKLQEKIS